MTRKEKIVEVAIRIYKEQNIKDSNKIIKLFEKNGGWNLTQEEKKMIKRVLD